MLKKYDLEERTEKFAKEVVQFCRRLTKDVINIELIKQVIRASGSVGANYIEANESLSKKDFFYRIKICRKESKESGYWLRIIFSNSKIFEKEMKRLIKESMELMNIFGAILRRK